MREYDDDNIRLYTPVLQRIIILVAVIIAVPVVMWTITAFVRTYVAPPKVPIFQPLSLTRRPCRRTMRPPASRRPRRRPRRTPSRRQRRTPRRMRLIRRRPPTPMRRQPRRKSLRLPSRRPRLPGAADQRSADASCRAARAGRGGRSRHAPAPGQNFAWPSPTTSPPAIPPCGWRDKFCRRRSNAWRRCGRGSACAGPAQRADSAAAPPPERHCDGGARRRAGHACCCASYAVRHGVGHSAAARPPGVRSRGGAQPSG